MEDMSRHIVISMILLLILLFFLLLSNRIYAKRRIRLRNLQLQEGPQHTSGSQSSSPVSTIPIGWHRVPGTFTPSPSGNGLRFTPSPHGRGDVIVNIPFGMQFWNGQNPLNQNQTEQNSERQRDWIDDTPSVWGIDLGRRGARGGLRGGAAVIVPTPGGVVVASTTRGPGMLGLWERRRGVYDDVAMEEGEGLPRYEEPPPGYEKVLAEGGTTVEVVHGEVGESSQGSSVRPEEINSSGVINTGDRDMVLVPDSPAIPEPAMTRDRSAT